MTEGYSINLRLDKRRMKKDGTFPIKLRVYIAKTRSQKYFSTGYSLTEEDFDLLYNERQSLTPAQQKQLEEFCRHEDFARQVAAACKPFSIPRFEQLYLNDHTAATSIHALINRKMGELNKEGRLSTAQSYDYTIRSINAFLDHTGTGEPYDLSIYQVTGSWLEQYTSFLQNELNHSPSTCGISLRNLRHILKRALEEGYLDKEHYPFGKGGFQIHTSIGKNKTLTNTQIKALIEADLRSPEQQKARDFWLFSYLCNGMTMQEIALLKFEHLHADLVQFSSHRSGVNSQKKRPQHKFYLAGLAYTIIDRYSNEHQFPHNYVFPILSLGDSQEQIYTKIKRFTRFVNQHIKKIAEREEIPSGISTDWARQSRLAHARVA